MTLFLIAALVISTVGAVPCFAQQVVSNIGPNDNGESWERKCPREDDLTESQMAAQVRHIEMGWGLTGSHVNIEGTALIQVAVAKDGSLSGARALSGHPLAVSQLIAAAQAWRFKPLVRDGVVRSFCGPIRIKFVLVNNRPSVSVISGTTR